MANDTSTGAGMRRARCAIVPAVLVAFAAGAPAAAMNTYGSGEALYQVVEDYSAMGIHRVGTEVDKQTVDWFGDALENLGGTVELQPFTFYRYETDSTVTIDGETVP